jgi:AAA+ ATPase superfamily predicted ATPase
MRFYGREEELSDLAAWDERSRSSAQMTVVVGRRRVGKTTMVKRAFGDESLYLFVSKKSEPLLCAEFIGMIQQALGVDVPGRFDSFREVFKYLLQLSKTRHITLIIDEFQEFMTINRAIYSEMQDLWDSNKAESRIHLILCGSLYSLMKKIFEDSREPLFQRADHRIVLKPLSVDILRTILRDNLATATNDDLLALHAVTGGTPRYLELLVDAQALTKETILDAMVAKDSFFLSEGKNILIEEFSREYTTYFSILSLIAASKSARSAIEGELERSVGPQLEKLENEFNIIRRVSPILAKPNTRQIVYEIEDNFLAFWFRFIYRNQSAIEIGNLDYVRRIIARDYQTFAGRALERYFKEQLALSKRYSRIGSWWDNKGENEIDIVALNEDEGYASLFEVKLSPKRLRIGDLPYKAAKLLGSLKGYEVEYRGLTIEDM